MNGKPKLTRSGCKRIITIYAVFFSEAALFLIAAGRIDLPRFWIYLGLVAGLQTIIFILLFTRFPLMIEVVNARGKIKPVKVWDKMFIALYSLSSILVMPVLAGLDVGRFGWSNLSPWWMIPGIIIFLCSMLVTEWALYENKFFETTVRIQKERGQKVVSTGPYAIIRHPGYAAMIALYFSFPLIVGSFYTLLISLFITLIFILRTALEDAALQKELEGYLEYTKKTRYRLLPFIY